MAINRREFLAGAGGAARSIVDALGRSGVDDVAIVNRTDANAVAVTRLAAVARVGRIADIADADLLVNTTSVGMGTGELPVGTGLGARSVGPCPDPTDAPPSSW